MDEQLSSPVEPTLAYSVNRTTKEKPLGDVHQKNQPLAHLDHIAKVLEDGANNRSWSEEYNAVRNSDLSVFEDIKILISQCCELNPEFYSYIAYQTGTSPKTIAIKVGKLDYFWFSMVAFSPLFIIIALLAISFDLPPTYLFWKNLFPVLASLIILSFLIRFSRLVRSPKGSKLAAAIKLSFVLIACSIVHFSYFLYEFYLLYSASPELTEQQSLDISSCSLFSVLCLDLVTSNLRQVDFTMDNPLTKRFLIKNLSNIFLGDLRKYLD